MLFAAKGPRAQRIDRALSDCARLRRLDTAFAPAGFRAPIDDAIAARALGQIRRRIRTGEPLQCGSFRVQCRRADGHGDRFVAMTQLAFHPPPQPFAQRHDELFATESIHPVELAESRRTR